MAHAVPYCGPPPTPGALAGAWNLDPVALAVATLPVLIAVATGRSRQPALAATVALGVAFVSPLCALTVALFSARALHHLVLIGLAGPALALVWPMARTVGPATATVALSAILWLWHLPPVYAAAWGDPAVYWALQVALVGASWGFWSVVLRDRDHGAAAVSVLAVAGQMGLIGAILTFSPRILYAEHLAAAEAFGLTALADQQLAGLVMWVPGMLPLAAAGAVLVRRGWLRAVAA